VNALDVLDLAHAEMLAVLAPKLTARRNDARDNPTSSNACQLQNAEAFSAGVDYAIQIVRQGLVKLEDYQTQHTQDPLEFGSETSFS
jgi:hypothetical protein